MAHVRGTAATRCFWIFREFVPAPGNTCRSGPHQQQIPAIDFARAFAIYGNRLQRSAVVFEAACSMPSVSTEVFPSSKHCV